MGQIFLIVKKIDDAEKMAKEVQAINPENVDGLVLMAGVLAAKNDINGGIAHVEAALKKAPDDLSATMLLAELHAKSGKMELAISSLEKLNEKIPLSMRRYRCWQISIWKQRPLPKRSMP